jgi:hypothetical protein
MNPGSLAAQEAFMHSRNQRTLVLALSAVSLAGSAWAKPGHGHGGDDKHAAKKADHQEKKAEHQQRQQEHHEQKQEVHAQRQERVVVHHAVVEHRQARQQAAVVAGRLSRERQTWLIRQQRAQIATYNQRLVRQQQIAVQRATLLQQQRRLNQYRYQQDYLSQLRQQQLALASQAAYDYDNDPYYYTAPTYRYSRAGRSYETNQYGADILKQSVNYGYEQGLRAGQADRADGYRQDYRSSYAYQDANYGYTGRYVAQADYNYYFREGFRRGYEDGYGSRSQYGAPLAGGKAAILANVLTTILNLRSLR